VNRHNREKGFTREQDVNRRHLVAALGLPEVNGIDVHSFRQFFLCQTGGPEVLSNTLSQEPSIILRNHFRPGIESGSGGAAQMLLAIIFWL